MRQEQRSASDAWRALARRVTTGALATIGTGKIEGAPYASLVLVAWDDLTRPILLLSSLAEHTKNLAAHPEASLLVHEPLAADPLAAERATILGRCAPLEGDASAAAKRSFLAAHPGAAGHAAFADFRMFRIEPRTIRWIGGFGAMAWIDVAPEP